MELERERRRRSFDDVAETYDRVRPRYPAPLVDALHALLPAKTSARVLEIGCGTGQATIALAERGHHVVAVELGSRLAALARRNLAPFPRVRIVTSTFEDWPLPSTPFDLALAATAFHWLDARRSLPKIAEALAPAGLLAIVRTHHIAGGDASFFAASQACYEHWLPQAASGFRLPSASDVARAAETIDGAQGWFALPRTMCFEWERPYTAERYGELLSTHSDIGSLDPAVRNGLIACIVGLIDARFGGAIVARYASTLTVTRRR